MPIVALGLASNEVFIQKVMQAVNPRKFKSGASMDSKITLKDFVKIFQKDNVSVKLTDLLCQRIIDKQIEAQTKSKRA